MQFILPTDLIKRDFSQQSNDQDNNNVVDNFDDVHMWI
jgi:hypothetical protein